MMWIPKSAAALAGMCADTVARYAMSGVLAAAEASGNWRLTATNGKLLAILRGESRPNPEDEASAAKLPPVESLLSSAIIPADEWAKLMKAVPKPRRSRKAPKDEQDEKKPAERQAGILLASPEIVLAAGDSVFRCLPVEGRFPDASLILPKRPAPVSFRVDPFLFAELLLAAGEVARQDGTVGVEVLFWARDRPIGVVAQGANGVFFDGLIQPLT